MSQSSHPREQPVYPFFLTARLQQAYTENDEILGRSLNQERKFKKLFNQQCGERLTVY